MIDDVAIPVLMEKLWGGIDKVRSNFIGEGYDVGRIGQSRLFYGFPLEREWGQVWCGVSHVSWLLYKTPCEIQIRRDWIKDDLWRTEIDVSFRKHGFQHSQELEYAFPISITDRDIVGVLVSTIKSKLSDLETIFDEGYMREVATGVDR
jgi:hypothetical protein